MTSFTTHVAADTATRRPLKAVLRPVAGLAIAGALVVLGACGGDSDSDDSSSSTDDLVEVMVDTGAPEDTATCVAEKLDGVSASELQDFLTEVADGEDVEATSGVGEQFVNASAECNLAE
jgi:hypothetical protein